MSECITAVALLIHRMQRRHHVIDVLFLQLAAGVHRSWVGVHKCCARGAQVLHRSVEDADWVHDINLEGVVAGVHMCCARGAPVLRRSVEDADWVYDINNLEGSCGRSAEVLCEGAPGCHLKALSQPILPQIQNRKAMEQTPTPPPPSLSATTAVTATPPPPPPPPIPIL
ncbi:hypothetical protein OSB04_021478 [Centaurea solstitialis]|uniref:Uncharacterized protein n=1 Tax=Centaurea solstitialis TaxID=347529 RepID=A0AA38T6C0_9ASTR|nr:hypothetical protein OSB04_021478 [Centaurea solstitialis]